MPCTTRWIYGLLACCTGDFLKIAGQTLAGFLADPNIDGVLCMLPALGSPLHQNVLATPAFFADLHLEKFNKPLVVAMYGNARDRMMEELKPVPGIACYGSVEQAAHALGQLYRYHQAISRPLESWVRSEIDCPSSLPGQLLRFWVRRLWNFWRIMKFPASPAS